MPDNIIFKPIELSGRGKRLNEKLDTSFEGMVGDVFNSIKKIMVNFDMDYYIFGHSMGAWIVLELLYYFKEYHLLYPKGVILSGNIPPCFYHKSDPPLHLLPDKIFLEEVSKLGGISGKIIKEKQFVEYFVPIIKNDFKLSDFDALEFFRAYNPDIREDIVTFIDNYRDIGVVNEDMIVLTEDKKNNEYVNVTDFLRNIKVENIYGHYDDGWTDEEAKFNVMSGEHGQIHFEIMYPGELTGNESIEIDANGEKETLDLVSNITYYEIDTTPNTLIPINMKSNFYMPDAKEQRGDKKLSFILNIKIE